VTFSSGTTEQPEAPAPAPQPPTAASPAPPTEPPTAASPAPAPEPAPAPAGPPPRRPRKVFLVVGLAAAAALAVGLFTGVGTGGKASRPQVGDQAPTFSLPKLDGSGTVGTPANGGGNGRPAVLLFFGNWCPQCHSELPALASAIHAQQQTGGPLAHVSVIGVDDFDRTANAKAFAQSSGVTFPVAFDPVADVTNGLYYFPGDPAAVFIDGNGTISAIRYGPITADQLTTLAKNLSH
jgi:peroxiredoxin